MDGYFNISCGCRLVIGFDIFGDSAVYFGAHQKTDLRTGLGKKTDAELNLRICAKAANSCQKTTTHFRFNTSFDLIPYSMAKKLGENTYFFTHHLL